MASIAPLGPVAAGVIVAVVFFAWGWARAARFRSEHGKPPWGISPTGWGAIHVALLPVAWILYFAASRTTSVSDLSLAHRDDVVIADTAEDRHKLRQIIDQLPLLRPPQTGVRGWHPDPLGQRRLRFFDGQRWTREVTDDPARRAADAVGDVRADFQRRLRALPAPVDAVPSWHLDPLGQCHFRYFDGHAWTDEVREARTC